MTIDFADAESALQLDLPIEDVYNHPYYGRSAELIDNGAWECAYDSDRRVAFPYIRRPIDRLDGRGLYDIVSPYGYGGISMTAGVDIAAVKEFRREFLSTSRCRGLVAEFLRLNPLVEHPVLVGSVDATEQRETFGSYITDPNVEFQDTSGQHRTAVRKAKKNGVAVQRVDTSTLLDLQSPFRRIYGSTMERVGSRPSLRLGTPYFQWLCRLPEDSVVVLEALQDELAVAAAIFLRWGDRVHYHLSGSTLEGRKVQATDLIIDHAVRMLGETPFWLHLGGGYKPGDSLARFKRQASSRTFTMVLTKLVVNDAVYRELSEGIQGPYFPAYRNSQSSMSQP